MAFTLPVWGSKPLNWCTDMKKTILMSLTMLTLAILPSNAQWLRVWKAGESNRVALADAASIPYDAAGKTLTIEGTAYSTAEIDSITIVSPITISWNGATASVNIPENVQGVTAEVKNGDVVITNTNEWAEQELILSGIGTGSLTYNGSYKTKFHLNGVTLTANSGAALDIKCGKRIDLILEDGTVNSLTDAANGSQKAALNCQGHLEVSGSGNLTIAGKTAHGLRTKEYLFIKKSVGSISVTEAVGDAIHCGEYFTMNGGNITLSGYGADGLQMETAFNSEEENNGIFTINGGTLNVTQSKAGGKAVRADSTVAVMNINGGTINITLEDNATDSKGLVSDGTININESSATTAINIDVLSNGYKDKYDEKIRSTGIKAETSINIAAGTIKVNAKGKYSRGIRSSRLAISGGTLTVTNTGDNSQGIKLYDKSYYSKTGGTVTADSFKYDTDD